MIIKKRKRMYLAIATLPLLAEALFLPGTVSANNRSAEFAVQDDYEWEQYKRGIQGAAETQETVKKGLSANASRQDVQKYVKDSLNSGESLGEDIKIKGRKKNEDGSYQVAITYYGPENGQRNLVVQMGKDGEIYDANTAMSDQELQQAYDEIVYGGKNEMSVFDVISVNDVLHSKSTQYFQNVSNNLGIDPDTASKAAASGLSLAGVVIMGAGASGKQRREIFETAYSEARTKQRKAQGIPCSTGALTGTSGNKDYDAWITQYAYQENIPANLLFCMIQAESNFDPNAVSSCGAIGLAQFMPDTAAGRGVDPYDPESSIKGAARYLRENYDQFGSWELALAAYNAGPGAVKDAGGIPNYSETQNYVQKIMANYNAMPKPLEQVSNGSKAEIETLVDTAFQKVDGRVSKYGGNGCAETVTCAGAFYNQDLQTEFVEGTARVDTLRQHLENKGYACTAFDGTAEKGDLLIYGDDAHIVIADGAGGCFGNSSSLGYAKHYDNAAYAWNNGELPTKIIKMSK